MSVDVHHEVTGPAHLQDAPVLVLSNSLGTTLEMWDPQMAALAERFRVVRYDTRGHGRSPVPPGPYSLDDLGGDVLALLDRLELDRVSWAGVSLGGMIGMWLGIHAPERIDRLVLCCTSAHMPPPEAWHERMAKVREGGSVEAVADVVLGRWLTAEYVAAHPVETAAVRAMLAGQPPKGYVACCAAIAEMDLRADLPSIAAPTLVIAGKHDTAAPPDAHGRVIAEAIPTVSYWVVDGAHLANVDAADTVTALIMDHLGGAA